MFFWGKSLSISQVMVCLIARETPLFGACWNPGSHDGFTSGNPMNLHGLHEFSSFFCSAQAIGHCMTRSLLVNLQDTGFSDTQLGRHHAMILRFCVKPGPRMDMNPNYEEATMALNFKPEDMSGENSGRQVRGDCSASFRKDRSTRCDQRPLARNAIIWMTMTWLEH